MRLQEHFPHYFPRQANELGKLFDNAIFVFDTNVYLDLYRLGPVARSEVLNALRQSIPNRVWIPHHVALEISKNRTALVLESSDNLEQHLQNIRSGLVQAKQVLEDAKLAQSIDQAVIQAAAKSIEATFQTVVEDVTKKIEACATPSSDDEILAYINEHLKSRPITAPLQDWYTQSAKEAFERYSKKLPPGYKDERKDEIILGSGQVSISQKYGDYYIWKQLLEAIKSSPSDFEHVVFVTSDRKEDWWEITRGKTLGARPELKLEITDAGAKTFHMYQLPRLVELLKDYAASHEKQPTISDETLAEVREVEVQPPSGGMEDQFGYAHGLSFSSKTHQFPQSSFRSAAQEGFHGYFSQSAVKRWLVATFLNATVVENKGFPDLVVSELRDDVAVVHGVEVVTPRNPDHLHALVMGQVGLANGWLGFPGGLLSGLEVRRFIFVVTINSRYLGGALSQSFWKNSAEDVRKELATTSNAELIVGTIDDGVFHLL